MVKQFQCQFRAFNVTAESAEDVLKHVQTHKADRHTDKDVSEDICGMMGNIEIRQRS
jgi:predicted small metal-binding protein